MMRLAAFILSCAAFVEARAHESPIDHVDRSLRFSVRGGDLVLQYRLRKTPRAALLELRAIDEDGDGRISQTEREQYFESRGKRLAKLMRLVERNKAIPFEVSERVLLHPDFSQEFHFTARLEGAENLEFTDGFSKTYPGSLVLEKSISDGKSPLLTIRESPKMSNKRGHVDLTVLELNIKRDK